jgi:branched-chain amino acid transport system ATP-binding protein
MALGATGAGAQLEAREPILECSGLTRYFGALPAVKDLSFTVGRGSTFGIAGPNGAGKTTLFNLLSGHVPASGGTVLLEGAELLGTPAHEICRRGLARTFQTPLVFETGSVIENLLLACYFGRSGLRVRLGFDRASKDAAEEWLEYSGLQDKRHAVASSLSVFEKKRLMLGAALATRPRLLLLDEPVGGLNHAETDDFLRLLEQVRSTDVTLVLIEHVMKVLMALSDRVLIMHHGERLAEGRPEEISRDRQVVEVYLGQGLEAT